MLGCYGKWHDSPKEEDMHVMKFISLAAVLSGCDSSNSCGACSGSANANATHHQARSHHQCLVELGQRDVQQLLCRVPWERWQGQWPGSLRNEGVAGRSDRSGAEQRRKVSRGARRGCDPRTGHHAVPREQRYAGVGTAVFEPQPGSGSTGTAKDQQPGLKDLNSADEIAQAHTLEWLLAPGRG